MQHNILDIIKFDGHLYHYGSCVVIARGNLFASTKRKTSNGDFLLSISWTLMHLTSIFKLLSLWQFNVRVSAEHPLQDTSLPRCQIWYILSHVFKCTWNKHDRDLTAFCIRMTFSSSWLQRNFPPTHPKTLIRPFNLWRLMILYDSFISDFIHSTMHGCKSRVS